MATVILKNRHSLQGCNLKQLIIKIRDGNLVHMDELASFQEGKTLADLSIEELKTAFEYNLLSENTLDVVLKMAGRDVNLDNCRLAVHEAICFANEFGQPMDRQLYESSESGSKDDVETEFHPTMESQKPTRRLRDLVKSVTDRDHRLKSKTDLKMSTRTSLFDAVKNNNLLTVNSLIQSGTCDVNIQDKYGLTPLHRAVQKSRKEIIQCLLDQIDCNVNIQNRRGYTPLHIAVQDGHIEIVRCLIDSTTCDVNLQDRDRTSPLHTAAKEGNVTIVQCLMENSTCDVNIQDRDGYTPLHIALLNSEIELVRFLIIRTECDVNIQDRDGNTPLHTAVYKGNVNIVRYLTWHKACDVNLVNSYSDTPLHRAVLKGNIDIVKCLIEHTTCDVNKQESDGNAPLHLAVQEGYIDIVRCLKEHTPCDINIQDSVGNTPLHIAVKGGNLNIVLCLLARLDCNVNIQNITGDTPLHIAVWRNDIATVRCLLKHTTCHVNIQDSRGYTPLHIAVQKGYITIVKYLIKHTTCDINIQDSRGYTPLHTAVQYKNLDIVRCLKENSTCIVNITNNEGYSPFSTADGLQTLHKIAKCQDVEYFHYLIQHNADVLTNHVDNQLQLVKFILSENDFKSLWFFIQNGLYINCLTSSGENLVHLLAQFYINYLYIDFSFLFDYGLDFNLINNDGNSPLMVASLLNNSPFIQFLAALPCDVNRQNHQGHTALHLCVIGFTLIKEKLNMMKINSVVRELCAREYYPRYIVCIDTLLNLGADVNIQDIDGKTVFMLACVKNDKKLLEILLIGGADVNIVDNHGRSALQYIDLTNNVYDLTCFNLLLSHGCRQSFNQPCLNGNTIIQNVLQFTPLWQIDHIVNFIKFLVFKNVNLQLLTSDEGEISYGQLSLEEFSSESRHELRQIFYLSGGSFVQITQILHFEVEENYEASLPKSLREKPREKFYLFANNLSLKEICRRVIRQNTGLEIHDRMSELLYFPTLTDFLMFIDIDSERFSLPVHLENCIDNDDYDDDYDSYDLNKENDDYANDYLMYIDCKYLNEVKVGLKQIEININSDTGDMDSDLSSIS